MVEVMVGWDRSDRRKDVRSAEVRGGVVMWRRREGVSRISKVRGVVRDVRAVVIVERMEVRVGEVSVNGEFVCVCVRDGGMADGTVPEGVLGVFTLGWRGGTGPGPRVGSGERVDVGVLDGSGAVGTAFGAGSAMGGANRLVSPSTNAKRPCCCNRPRSRPYARTLISGCAFHTLFTSD